MSSSPFSREPVQNFFVASPFDSSVEEECAVAATAPEGSYTYSMIASHPAVDSSEVETNVAALEVTVKWGANVVHVAHLSPVRAFAVGEEGCDFTMSREQLGAARVEIVSVEGGIVRVPSLDKKLEGNDTAKVELGGVSFEIKCVKAGRKVAGPMKINGRAAGLGILAAALHAGMFAAMFAFTPSLESTDDATMRADQSASLNQVLTAMAEREDEALKNEAAASTETPSGGDEGSKAKGPEGKMGSTTPVATNGKFALKGHSQTQMISRANAIADAQDFGMIGLLNTMSGDPDALKADWGAMAMGHDPISAQGNMWADAFGAANGNGGLGLSGDGFGGSGRGESIGLGDIGTIGHTMGNCVGSNCSGWSNGIPGGTHTSSPPRIKQKAVEGSSRIPADVLQRVIQRNFGRFRACYETGLHSNPALAGRVSVAITISADGSVSSASNAGSDLPDAGVVSCIVRNFGGLNFPAPDAVVHVVYPLALSPQ